MEQVHGESHFALYMRISASCRNAKIRGQGSTGWMWAVQGQVLDIFCGPVAAYVMSFGCSSSLSLSLSSSLLSSLFDLCVVGYPVVKDRSKTNKAAPYDCCTTTLNPTVACLYHLQAKPSMAAGENNVER